ncbi:MAG: hypothetical protein Q9168_005304 [Polycauliona sp. 1 TL-2023]
MEAKLDIVLFPERDPEGDSVDVQALVDESLPFSIISRETLEGTGASYTSCLVKTVKDARGVQFSPIGKVDLRWHKKGFPKSHGESFRVVDEGLPLAILGATAFYLEADDISDVSSTTSSSSSSSMFSGKSFSSSSTTGTIEDVRGATEVIADLLLDDDVLHPLFPKALEVMDIDSLEKKLRKLLNAWGKELRTEANALGPVEQRAARFFRKTVRQIVSHMGIQLDPKRRQTAQQLDALVAQKVSKKDQFDPFMADEAVQTYVQEPDAASSSGSSEQEAPQDPARQNPLLLHRKQVQSFIQESNALVNLRERFDLAIQSHLEDRPSLEAVADFPAAVDVMDLPIESSTDEVEGKSGESIGEPPARGIWHDLRWLFSATLRRCVQPMLRVAEHLELREKILEPGYKRIRWTCVSGSHGLVPSNRYLAPKSL